MPRKQESKKLATKVDISESDETRSVYDESADSTDSSVDRSDCSSKTTTSPITSDGSDSDGGPQLKKKKKLARNKKPARTMRRPKRQGKMV